MVARALIALTTLIVSTTVKAQVTDTEILNYALTLEHLESTFYSQALAKFNQSDFASAEEYELFGQIAAHEAAHVTILESVLGKNATQACNYTFPYTDVQGFKSLAMVLEGVGTSAYLGAAQFLTSKTMLTAAGSILATEARHAAWLATVNAEDPWTGSFETPLTLDEVYSLAVPFINSCPKTNPTLPVKAFPTLTLASANGTLAPGANITLTMPPLNNTKAANETLHVAFLWGLGTNFVKYEQNQSVTIPAAVNATGTVYAVISTSNVTVTDDNTVAGPVILMFGSAMNATNTTMGSNATSTTYASTDMSSPTTSPINGVATGAALEVRSVNSMVLALGLVVAAMTMVV